MSARAGFTLLELLVAITITALIVTLLVQTGQVGGRALTRLHRFGQTQAAIVPIERALRDMIEHIDPGRFPEPPRLVGNAHRFAFATALPGLSAGANMPADVTLEVVQGQLVLWWSPAGGGEAFNKVATAQQIVLLEHIAQLDIAYAAKGKGTAWRSEWREPTLPGLVRLHLVAEPGQRGWPPIIVRPLGEPAEE